MSWQFASAEAVGGTCCAVVSQQLAVVVHRLYGSRSCCWLLKQVAGVSSKVCTDVGVYRGAVGVWGVDGWMYRQERRLHIGASAATVEFFLRQAPSAKRGRGGL